jgi:hypothetical protein
MANFLVILLYHVHRPSSDLITVLTSNTLGLVYDPGRFGTCLFLNRILGRHWEASWSWCSSLDVGLSVEYRSDEADYHDQVSWSYLDISWP